jgi:hypothetical protein
MAKRKQTVDLVTRIAEREWRHHTKYPNRPMPVVNDIRAELDRLARQVRERKHAPDILNLPQYVRVYYNSAIGDVLALIKEATR